MADCGVAGGLFQPGCVIGNAANEVANNAIDNLADSVVEGFGQAVAAMGTMWVNIGTPNLIGTREATVSLEGAPTTAITTVLGYVTWFSLLTAVLSLLALGAMLAVRSRRGEGGTHIGKIGIVLGALILASAASALVSALWPTQNSNAAGAAQFIQNSLWWYMTAAAILSVIIGACRMAWEQRADPGRELLKSLMTLIVVTGAGVTIISLLVGASDTFSVWILKSSLDCTGDACFGQSVLELLALPDHAGEAAIGVLLVIILGVVAIFATFIQILLMVARGGMLVVLVGILPLAASATNTEMGRTWFKKCIAWLVAFILYKPAAAIIYATAFQLFGSSSFRDDGSGLLEALSGLMLMLLALFALPALMRFVTPMVGSMASGNGGTALAGAALGALPSGAAALGRMASGSGRQSGGGTSAPSSSDKKTNSSAPTGGGTSSTGKASQSSSTPQTGGAATGGKAAAGGGSAAAGGAAAGGGGAAAAGGGAAAAGAAAGPVGIATVAAAEGAKKVGQATVSGLQAAGEHATGEGDGPNGSR